MMENLLRRERPQQGGWRARRSSVNIQRSGWKRKQRKEEVCDCLPGRNTTRTGNSHCHSYRNAFLSETAILLVRKPIVVLTYYMLKTATVSSWNTSKAVQDCEIRVQSKQIRSKMEMHASWSDELGAWAEHQKRPSNCIWMFLYFKTMKTKEIGPRSIFVL